MRNPLFHPPVTRLRVTPDRAPGENAPITAPRPRGSRRPHTDGKVAEVQALIEQTILAYGEIAKRTGVGRASICRWARILAGSGPRSRRARPTRCRARGRARSSNAGR